MDRIIFCLLLNLYLHAFKHARLAGDGTWKMSLPISWHSGLKLMSYRLLTFINIREGNSIPCFAVHLVLQCDIMLATSPNNAGSFGLRNGDGHHSLKSVTSSELKSTGRPLPLPEFLRMPGAKMTKGSTSVIGTITKQHGHKAQCPVITLTYNGSSSCGG